MYCANCGNSMDPNAAVCIRCGYQKGTGSSYCSNCGSQAIPGASMCTRCGCMLSSFMRDNAKSRIAAGILAIFLGCFGVHNFYLGNTGRGVAQLLISVLTCGIGAFISGIWSFIEGIMLLTGGVNVDGRGLPLRD